MSFWIFKEIKKMAESINDIYSKLNEIRKDSSFYYFPEYDNDKQLSITINQQSIPVNEVIQILCDHFDLKLILVKDKNKTYFEFRKINRKK